MSPTPDLSSSPNAAFDVSRFGGSSRDLGRATGTGKTVDLDFLIVAHPNKHVVAMAQAIRSQYGTSPKIWAIAADTTPIPGVVMASRAVGRRQVISQLRRWEAPYREAEARGRKVVLLDRYGDATSLFHYAQPYDRAIIERSVVCSVAARRQVKQAMPSKAQFHIIDLWREFQHQHSATDLAGSVFEADPIKQWLPDRSVLIGADDLYAVLRRQRTDIDSCYSIAHRSAQAAPVNEPMRSSLAMAKGVIVASDVDAPMLTERAYWDALPDGATIFNIASSEKEFGLDAYLGNDLHVARAEDKDSFTTVWPARHALARQFRVFGHGYPLIDAMLSSRVGPLATAQAHLNAVAMAVARDPRIQ